MSPVIVRALGNSGVWSMGDHSWPHWLPGSAGPRGVSGHHKSRSACASNRQLGEDFGGSANLGLDTPFLRGVFLGMPLSGRSCFPQLVQHCAWRSPPSEIGACDDGIELD
jgi:hypothetical protein